MSSINQSRSTEASSRKLVSTRRQFFAKVLGGAVVSAAWVSRSGFFSRVSAAEWEPSSGSAPTRLVEMSAAQLAKLLQTGQTSSVEIVTACLDQIGRVNDRINAVVQLCAERALKEAKLADQTRLKGQPTGFLHGIPFTIKDSLETEGVISTAGTLGLKDNVPSVDATAVARLRAAGGILLGKSNTPEFTLGGGARGTWNLVYGQTCNPYNLGHTPRGSSGGAGAIVASCGVPFDIGSDFGGSIRSPAHACGVVGIKPTFGRVPRTGHWPGYGGVFDSYQQLGPLSRSVGDAWEVLRIISGPDWKDAAIIPAPLRDPASVDLKKLRVAFYEDNGLMTPTAETRAMVRAAARVFEEHGASVTEDYHGGFAEFSEIRGRLRTADGGEWFQRMLDKAGTTEPSSGIRRYLTGEKLQTPEITLLLQKQDAIRSKLAAWIKNYDLILCPANAFPAPSFEKPVPGNAGYTNLYNLTGWPATVVRCGWSPQGLPLGLQLVAPPWREDISLAAAAFMETSFGGWKIPALAKDS